MCILKVCDKWLMLYGTIHILKTSFLLLLFHPCDCKRSVIPPPHLANSTSLAQSTFWDLLEWFKRKKLFLSFKVLRLGEEYIRR